ncbi:MAG: DUF2442 domain-containing protein [Bacteroidetes bacterium]|nr:DUF2442 domain-containing protein [Bacteroidota bacterium]
MNPRIAAVEYQSPYKLILTFTNKEVKEFDFSDYLSYPVYQGLKDEGYCSKARVFNGTVIWDEFTDFDPDTLYLESKPLIVA